MSLYIQINLPSLEVKRNAAASLGYLSSIAIVLRVADLATLQSSDKAWCSMLGLQTPVQLPY